MNYSDEELKGMSKGIFFDLHKRNQNIAVTGMARALEPLNERLKPLNMMVFLCDSQTMINPFGASSRAGLSIYLDDNEIEKMMSMTDEQLIKKLRRD